jgi:hypothetical protein
MAALSLETEQGEPLQAEREVKSHSGEGICAVVLYEYEVCPARDYLSLFFW